MKLNKTAYAILGLLTIEPMTGYAMRQMMKGSTSNFWSESDGQLYPALTLLSKQKLIVINKTKNESAREKKEYAITTAGHKVLKEWLKEPAETKIVRDEFMLKLFFSANVDSTVILDAMNKKSVELQSGIGYMIKTKKELLQYKEKTSQYLYWDITADYGIALLEAKLKWSNEAIKRILKANKKIK